MTKSLLLIEYDKPLASFIRRKLTREGYKIHLSNSGIDSLKIIPEILPDLIIFDWDFTQVEGSAICNEINSINSNIPIIVLSSRNSPQDVISSFEAGAGDYIAKPFDIRELIIRIKTRLEQLNQSEKIKIRDLILDDDKKEVKRRNKTIRLSRKEYDLLKYLMSNPNRVVNRNMILDRVWYTKEYIEPRVVDVYIGYLRKKIDKGFDRKLINTVRGFGYKLEG